MVVASIAVEGQYFPGFVILTLRTNHAFTTRIFPTFYHSYQYVQFLFYCG